MDALTALSFCCTNGLVCSLDYSGGTLGRRYVYPYSLKQAKNGNMILTAHCFPDGKEERFKYDLVTEVVPEPILAAEQGHTPNQTWLFNYPVPSLYNSELLRQVRIYGPDNQTILSLKPWDQSSTDERAAEIRRFLVGG